MTTSSTLGRRQFIQVVSMASAGLAIGFKMPGTKNGKEIFEESANNFAPDAWLRIDSSGDIVVVISKSEMGQGISTSMAMLLAEELEADWTKVRFERASADDKFGNMSTGGSSTTRSMWKPLRQAGAAAREMLITAASQKWNVPRESCRAENGSVVHSSSGKKIGYGELAAAAAQLKVPDNPPLKDDKNFRILGKRIHRLDTPEKVDGSAMFGMDVRVDGMLYAVVARSPVFGGKIKDYDASKAKAMPGVLHVVQIDEGIALVANNTWNAIQGRKALQVNWDDGANAGMSSSAIRSMFEEYSAKPGAVIEERGNIMLLDTSNRKVEAVYELPYLAHATMEPMNSTAYVQNDRCEIWAPTQNPQWARRAAAEALGFKQEQVTVHTTFLGGGFGRRFDPDFVMESVHTSKATGVPVKVVWTREDDMQHDWYRPASLHHLTAALSEKGTIIAFRNKMTGPSISGQRWPERVKDGLDHSAMEGGVNLEYDVPNFRAEYVMANTGVPIGYWRSVYASQGVFVLESFIDELAYAAGMNPYEFRRKNLKKDSRLKPVLDLVAEKAGWGSPLAKGRFRGIACAPPAFFGTYVAYVAEVSVEGSSIRVHRIVAAVDCGFRVNPDSIEAQIEGAVAFGLSAALRGEITIEKGRVVQGNFDGYPILSIDEMPKVEIHIIESTEPLGGMGEPGVPPLAPVIANAVYAATGKRLRKLPLKLA